MQPVYWRADGFTAQPVMLQRVVHKHSVSLSKAALRVHPTNPSRWRSLTISFSTSDAEDIAPSSRGSIALVGAGPGDPDLLTLAAARFISDSEALVISDRLVSDEVLALVKGELRIAGKLPGCAEKAQQEIYGWVAEAVANGRKVVRLKIGDPFVFGRGGEEVMQNVRAVVSTCGASRLNPWLLFSSRE